MVNRVGLQPATLTGVSFGRVYQVLVRNKGETAFQTATKDVLAPDQYSMNCGTAPTGLNGRVDVYNTTLTAQVAHRMKEGAGENDKPLANGFGFVSTPVSGHHKPLFALDDVGTADFSNHEARKDSEGLDAVLADYAAQATPLYLERETTGSFHNYRLTDPPPAETT